MLVFGLVCEYFGAWEILGYHRTITSTPQRVHLRDYVTCVFAPTSYTAQNVVFFLIFCSNTYYGLTLPIEYGLSVFSSCFHPLDMISGWSRASSSNTFHLTRRISHCERHVYLERLFHRLHHIHGSSNATPYRLPTRWVQRGFCTKNTIDASR